MEKADRNIDVDVNKKIDVRKPWQPPTVEELEVSYTDLTTGAGDDGIGGTS